MQSSLNLVRQLQHVSTALYSIQIFDLLCLQFQTAEGYEKCQKEMGALKKERKTLNVQIIKAVINI